MPWVRVPSLRPKRKCLSHISVTGALFLLSDSGIGPTRVRRSRRVPSLRPEKRADFCPLSFCFNDRFERTVRYENGCLLCLTLSPYLRPSLLFVSCGLLLFYNSVANPNKASVLMLYFENCFGHRIYAKNFTSNTAKALT